jgi:beta-glucanase (GH16 family)
MPAYLANNPTLAPLDDTWKLVWSDEFDGDTINLDNWGYEIGYVRNQEYQYYTDRPENAFLRDGKLVIRALREDYEGYAYTSASLNTLSKQEFQYGRFEMRARIPTAMGSWPAWWAMGTNITTDGWPRCGEVDMMEFYVHKLLFNVMDSFQAWSSVTIPFNDSLNFHTWTMEWDEQAIRLYFDGTLVNDYDLKRAQIGGYNPFKQKMYLLVNLAIGGTNGGDPSYSTFPMEYEIDYLRVYQKP